MGVVGAGVAGLAAAVALQRAGVPAVVWEAAPELRGGGSALALWQNAFRALDALGVGAGLRAAHPRLGAFELCAAGGAVLRRFTLEDCGQPDHEFRGVDRGRLLRELEAALAPGSVRYGAPVAGVRDTGAGAELVFADGRAAEPCRAVVGCDGARSRVAAALGVPPPAFCGYSAYRGVATFPDGLPPDVPAGTVRQLWGEGVRAGLYPMSAEGAGAAEVYWFVCFNGRPPAAEAGGGRLAPEEMKAHAAALTAGWSAGVREAVERTPPERFSFAPLADRWVADPARPWDRTLGGDGHVTLAGDAAHPMTPNLGQGGCCALEDAVVLARSVAGAADGGDLPAALRAYERERAERALPLTLRSYAFGALLQPPQPLVCRARNLVIGRLPVERHFLDHTTYDCGTLP